MSGWRAAWAILRNDLAMARAEPLGTVLSVLVPLNFLVLFALFALSGGRVPAAVVQQDSGPYGPAMVAALGQALTFDLLPAASPGAADAAIARSDAVATIIVPPGFSAAVTAGAPVALPVRISNANADFADDVRRALPLAVVRFYQAVRPGSLPVTWREQDTYAANVGFLNYIAVSLLVVSMLIGGLLLGGRGVAGEWEKGTMKALLLSPAPPLAVVAGKLGAGLITGAVSAGLVLLALLLIGVRPDAWDRLPGVVGVLALALTVFLSLGLAAGSLLRSVNAVTPLAFGVGLPLFFISGAFGPIAWSGAAAADVARAFPVAYANAVLQHAFHGYWTMRGGGALCWGVLAAWTAAALIASGLAYGRAAARH